MDLALVHIQPYDAWLNDLLIKLGLIEINDYSQIINGHYNDEEDDIDDDEYLRSLDPRNWKEQDHYKIFGLKSKRFFASEQEIKSAYRSKVLLHHPDKRAGRDEVDKDNDYFACITKAYEILGDPLKRRSYDSVDFTFNENIPVICAQSKAQFYSVFGPVFARNARWSNIQPVPLLGHCNSKREEVDHFYQFWYNFDSWREFSYLDEEDKERGQDRSERRWIEKQNKLARQKKKKEEMARIRRLVNNSYSCDPRIARFKEEDRLKKLLSKKAKEDAKRIKIEEEEKKRRRKEEEEMRKKKEEEEALKTKREQEKKEKEAIKKQKRKEKKHLEQLFEENNYFSNCDSEKVDHLKHFDRLCQTLEWSEFVQFKNDLTSAQNVDQKRDIFLNKVTRIYCKQNEEVAANVIKTQKKVNNCDLNSSTKFWTSEDMQLLIKAVNLFPAGTQNRWEVVSAFVNQHSCFNKTRKARDVLAKVKDMNKLDFNLKHEINQKAIKKLLENNEKKSYKINEAPSENYKNSLFCKGFNLNPWTNEEQQLLEQALKTYPTSSLDRWDLIAECIPSRSKKDCIQRYKELVEIIKAKKAAQNAVHTNLKKS